MIPASHAPARKPSAPRLRIAVRFSAYLLAFFLLCLNRWLHRNFGSPTLEQILYHVMFGSEGMLGVDEALVRSFARRCVLLPLALSSLALGGECFVRAVRGHGWREAARRVLAPLSRIASLAGPRLGALSVRPAPYLLLAGAAVHWLHSVSGFAFAASFFGPDYFSSHYVAPSATTLQTARKTKNLVLVYVESLEAGYGDRNIVGDDLLANLKRQGGVSFARYTQAPGTGWTIAAMTATQCGVPLKALTLGDGNRQGEEIRSFLPHAVCLGDILARHGYRNVFMGGASLEFAGKRKLLQDHGYQEVFGREEWLQAGVSADAMNWWGLYDDDLFDKAKAKLSQLHGTGQPFNLTLLTVDTHSPEGFASKRCPGREGESFGDIVRCSADQVADFIEFARRSGYLQDTNVVVVGDHLAMANPLLPKLASGGERTIFNAFISAQPPKKNREDIVPFDLFPTILEFVGIEVEGDRLGLGFSALNDPSALPPPERMADMDRSLLNRSRVYTQLWMPNAAAAAN